MALPTDSPYVTPLLPDVEVWPPPEWLEPPESELTMAPLDVRTGEELPPDDGFDATIAQPVLAQLPPSVTGEELPPPDEPDAVTGVDADSPEPWITGSHVPKLQTYALDQGGATGAFDIGGALGYAPGQPAVDLGGQQLERPDVGAGGDVATGHYITHELTPLQEYERQTERERLDPIGAVVEDSQRELDRRRAMDEAAARADEAHSRRVRDLDGDRRAALQRQRQALERLDVESKELANDPGLSGGQMIAGIIGAVIGGMLNPGGPNSTVQMMQQVIQANREQRRAALQQRRALIGDTANLDEQQYVDGLRTEAAVWERAKQQALDIGKQFDPAGTGAAIVRREVQNYEGNRQAALSKAGELAFDQEMRAREQYRKELETAQKLGMLPGRVEGGGGGGAGAATTPAAQGRAIRDVAAELGLDDEKRKRLIVVNADTGEYALANTFEGAAESNKLVTATNQFTTVASRLASNIEKYGWEPTNARWKSEVGGQMMNDYASLTLLVKRMDQAGALDKGLLEFMDNLLGGEPGKANLGSGQVAQLRQAIDNQTALTRGVLSNAAGHAVTYNPPLVGASKREPVPVGTLAKTAARSHLPSGELEPVEHRTAAVDQIAASVQGSPAEVKRHIVKHVSQPLLAAKTKADADIKRLLSKARRTPEEEAELSRAREASASHGSVLNHVAATMRGDTLADPEGRPLPNPLDRKVQDRRETPVKRTWQQDPDTGGI